MQIFQQSFEAKVETLTNKYTIIKLFAQAGSDSPYCVRYIGYRSYIA